MLVLAIGDFHIPERAVDIPPKFKKLLQPRGKIQQVLCVGNVTSSPSSLQFLKSLSPDFQMVKGDHDKDLSLPLSLVFTYDKLKVGLIDGFEVVPKSDPLGLLAQARMMDVDILIYGSTHKVEAYTLDGKFFINPGSATGAFNADSLGKEDLDIIESILKEDDEADDDQEEIEGKSEEVDKGEKEESGKEKEKEKEKEEEKDKENGKESENGEKKGEKDVEKVEQKTDNDKSDNTESNVQPDTDAKETTTNTVEKTDGGKDELVDDDDEDDKLDTSEIEPYLDPIPSFCLLDLQGSTCTLYLYTLIDGEVKVDKLTYRKEESA
ncbi:DEKNAAC100318 [Brettanomyces naardenensis]|uniref:Vacuolar protein sorting-associated protein 29 n=1 Tax=Brettanomyces naardenensis TaxID=13370 RepID=A0A448YG57_BRENA|nr:DEKNAAC100318 [Brettanomyces naardenensis]